MLRDGGRSSAADAELERLAYRRRNAHVNHKTPGLFIPEIARSDARVDGDSALDRRSLGGFEVLVRAARLICSSPSLVVQSAGSAYEKMRPPAAMMRSASAVACVRFLEKRSSFATTIPALSPRLDSCDCLLETGTVISTAGLVEIADHLPHSEPPLLGLAADLALLELRRAEALGAVSDAGDPDVSIERRLGHAVRVIAGG
jgi:hypothetical protein